MKNDQPSPTCSSGLHYTFHGLFFAGMAIFFWLQWGPHSAVVWDTNCAVAFTLAAVQLALYALRFFVKPPGCRPPAAWEGAFYAASLGICLAEFRCGVPYYCFGWIFWVFLGLMLVTVPKRISITIGVIASILYVPMQVSWDQLGGLSFVNWFNWLYPLVFPWVLGLLIRQLTDSNNERARLIGELQAAKKELEGARDREGELATLRERERLARDLHDTLGHQLVMMTVQLEAAQRLLAVDPPRADALLKEIEELSRSSMNDLRRALDNLRAAGLGNRPLTTALQTLCAEAGKRFSLAVDCQVAAGADGLPPAVAEVIWCVAQEGLMNIGRHARAHHVRMNLSLLPREIVLRLADDGAGLPPGAEDKPGHYGLRGLRERVEGLGGTFRLATSQGGGTILEAHLPVII